MAALKFGGRTLAMLAMASLGLGAGCYATTPHRAEVALNAPPQDCSAKVAGVFGASGFVQVSAPPKFSMLFAARTSGPYTSFLTTDTGVGVTVEQGLGAETCHVTLEAVSQDVNCPGSLNGVSGTVNCHRISEPAPVERASLYDVGVSVQSPCPSVPQPMCELTYAPGAQNDAAVDELARRVQDALGPTSTVN
jgi:hypothetical protein